MINLTLQDNICNNCYKTRVSRAIMIFFFKYYYFNLFNIYISRDNEILTKTTYFLFNVKKKFTLRHSSKHLIEHVFKNRMHRFKIIINLN